MFTRIVLLLFLILGVFSKDCPGNCSGHGTCRTDTGFCVCSIGYAGDDCSYPFTDMASGVQLSNQNVQQAAWNFYRIRTYSSHSLTIQVSQQTAAMDVDLYVLNGGIPSISNWTYSNFDLSQNFEINIQNPGDAIWYMGCYGYTASTYSIKATVDSQCPNLNECNGHGSCVAPNVCQCETGWSGVDCSQHSQVINPGTPITGVTQTTGSWMFFELTLAESKEFSVIVNQTSAAGDIDLYLRFGQMPDLFNFDVRDVSITKDFSLTVTEPRAGLWYIGAYAFEGATYNIRVPSAIVPCPNMCSGSSHGTCQNNECNCATGFTGTACEEMTNALQGGVPVGGYVEADSWNYFYFAASTTEDLVILVNQTSGSADCDLYARSGQKPTRINFDYAHFGFDKEFSLTIPQPGVDTWYLGVYGYTDCAFSISVRISTQCPGTPACSGNGTCINGMCQCNTGFSGADCSSRVVNALPNGQALKDQWIIGSQNWKYYTFSISTPATALAVDLKEKSTDGSLWLFVSKGTNAPTLRVYDYADHHTGTAIHKIDAQLPQPQSGTWTIGIYSNPFSYPGDNITFSIAAWAPPF